MLFSSGLGGKVYFVPEGEEHPLRHDHERAGGGSAVLHNAPAFLVVSSSKGDLRADINDIIVKQVGDLDVFPMTQEKFTQKYEPRP